MRSRGWVSYLARYIILKTSATLEVALLGFFFLDAGAP